MRVERICLLFCVPQTLCKSPDTLTLSGNLKKCVGQTGWPINEMHCNGLTGGADELIDPQARSRWTFPGNCLPDYALPSQINRSDRLLHHLLGRSSLQPLHADLPHLTPRWHLWRPGEAARGRDDPVEEQKELWGNCERRRPCGRGFPCGDFCDRGGRLEVSSFKNLLIQIISTYRGIF